MLNVLMYDKNYLSAVFFIFKSCVPLCQNELACINDTGYTLLRILPLRPLLPALILSTLEADSNHLCIVYPPDCSTSLPVMFTLQR